MELPDHVCRWFGLSPIVEMNTFVFYISSSRAATVMKLAWPCVEWSQVPWIAPGSSIPLLWRLLLLPFIHHDWCVFFRLCCCESSLDSVHRRPSLVSNSPLPYWVRRASYQRVLSSGWHRFSPEFTETMTIHSSLNSSSIQTIQLRFEYWAQELSNDSFITIVRRWLSTQ